MRRFQWLRLPHGLPLAIGISSSLASGLFVLGYVILYDRQQPNVKPIAITSLAIAVIPNIVGVLAVFLISDWLKARGFSHNQEQLNTIEKRTEELSTISAIQSEMRDYLYDHVRKLREEVQIVDRLADAPWKDVFSHKGAVGILANFAVLPINQGKTALRNKFETHRNGHKFIFLDPRESQLVDNLAELRKQLSYANDPKSIKEAICESLGTLLDALPDGIVATSNQVIPGIDIMLSKRIVGYTSFWTDASAVFCSTQTVRDDVAAVPLLVAFADSSYAIREYGAAVMRRLQGDVIHPSLDELLVICKESYPDYWISKTKERLTAA